MTELTPEQEAAITRKVDARLLAEIERLRADLARWKREFRGYAVHDDARCEYFGECQCGLAALLAEAEEGAGPAGLEPEQAPVPPGTAQGHDSRKEGGRG